MECVVLYPGVGGSSGRVFRRLSRRPLQMLRLADSLMCRGMMLKSRGAMQLKELCLRVFIDATLHG